MHERTLQAINAAIDHYTGQEEVTNSAIAERLGISAVTFWNKRKGTTDWKWSEILALSEMLGLTPDELAGFCA